MCVDVCVFGIIVSAVKGKWNAEIQLIIQATEYRHSRPPHLTAPTTRLPHWTGLPPNRPRRSQEEIGQLPWEDLTDGVPTPVR